MEIGKVNKITGREDGVKFLLQYLSIGQAEAERDNHACVAKNCIFDLGIELRKMLVGKDKAHMVLL